MPPGTHRLPGASTDRKQAAYLKQVAVENCASGYLLRPGDAANFSIGQGDVAATPLQAAVMYAAIANGGTVRHPARGVLVRRPRHGGEGGGRPPGRSTRRH